MYNHSVIFDDCVRLYNNLDHSKLKNSSVFVTGANGLIGSFIADFLCYLNKHHNYNIKILLTSYSSPDRAKRISHLIGRQNVTYMSWDSSTKIDTEMLPKKLDFCFFCSGYGQPSKFLLNNVKTALLNVVGPESILNHMLSEGGNFVFLSTSELYGDPPEEALPTPETYCGSYELDNNRAAYKVSKSLGEVLCKEYNKDDKLSVKIARVALTYGPGALRSDKRVLQEFIFKSETGEINMLDEGSSIRNYLYITDSVEIIMNILLHGKSMVYNVGGDTEPISIYELATLIANTTSASVVKGKKKNASVKTAPKNVGLSMRKYREEFDYGNNVVPLKQGLKNTIKWFNYGDKNENG